MIRKLIAALSTVAVFIGAPAVVTPTAPGVAAHAADERADRATKKKASATEKKVAGADKAGAAEKKAAGKRRIPHNKKVGMNAKSKVFHDKTCRHFNDKLQLVSAREAKAAGAKPCKMCLK